MDKSKNKLHFYAILFGLSAWFIYLATIAEIMMQTITPLIVILLLYSLGKGKKIKLDNKDKMLLTFILIGTVSTIINLFIYSDYSVISRISGILYFFAIFIWYVILSNEKYSKKDYNFVKYSYILVGIISSIQVIYFSRYISSGKLTMISIFGSPVNPNHYAAFLSLIITFILIDILNNNNQSRKTKIFSILSLIIITCGIILTGSRAAFVGTIISCLLVTFQLFNSKINLWKIILSFLFIIIVIIVSTKLDKILPSWLYNRYIGNSYVDSSNMIRIEVWKNALRGIAKSPIYGFGFGLFNKIPEYSHVLTNISIPSSAPAHNTYLDILLYGGISGFIFFMIFLFKIIKSIFKYHKKYIPFVIDLIFLTIIVGADKSIYFWTAIILLSIIVKEDKKNERIS